jgi:hypothetical protein
MGGPSPEKGPGNRRQLQIDTTQKRLKAIPFQMPTESSFAVNRTVVTPDGEPQQQQPFTGFLKPALAAPGGS